MEWRAEGRKEEVEWGAVGQVAAALGGAAAAAEAAAAAPPGVIVAVVEATSEHQQELRVARLAVGWQAGGREALATVEGAGRVVVAVEVAARAVATGASVVMVGKAAVVVG